GVDQEPLVAAEAPGEPHRQAGHPPCRAAAVQPPICPRLSAERRVPVLLELCFTLLGGTFPGSVVHEDDALENRANEESRQDATWPSRASAELVPGQRPALQRRRGGI